MKEHPAGGARFAFLYAWRCVTRPSMLSSAARGGARGFSPSARVVLSVVCIALSLVPLITVMFVTDGMLEGVTQRVIDLLSSDISVTIPDDAPGAATAESLELAAAKLSGAEGVTGAQPELRGTALAAGGEERSGAYVRGVSEDAFLREPYLSLLPATEGEPGTLGQRRCVLGSGVAEALGVHPGDDIRIISANTTDGGRIIPRVRRYTVSAIVSSGYRELDALWVFVSLDDAFDTLGNSLREAFIGIKTDDPYSPDLNSRTFTVQRALLADPDSTGESGIAFAEPWTRSNAELLENFYTSKALLTVVTAMIVLVAFGAVSASVLVIVMERKREVAYLKACGAAASSVAAAFVLVGIFIGAAGVALGTACGVLVSLNINGIISGIERAVTFFENLGAPGGGAVFHLLDPAYYLQRIPVAVNASELFVIGACALLLAAVVSVIPAIRAAGERPSETLRGAS